MPVPCLLKLPDNTWVHYSRGIANAVARSFNGKPTKYKLPEEDPFRPGGGFVDALPATMSEADAVLAERCPLPFRLEKLSHEEEAKWRQALDALESLDWTPGAPPSRGRIIPQTELRKLYQQLRDMPFAGQSVLANDPAEPACLQRLFEQSVRDFWDYDNPHDTFCPTRIWWEADPAAAFGAHELQALLDPAKTRPGDIVWSPEGPQVGFTTVDFEVSPLRTTNYAILDDGSSGERQGHGGMDLLLRSEDGTPMVAEIKGAGDSNLFLALVQALTYAVELTTPHQYRRLKRSYPEAFGSLDTEHPRSDVSLVYLGEDDPPLKEATVRIARVLLEGDGGAVARTVRRIAFLRVRLDGEGKLRITCEALVPAR